MRQNYSPLHFLHLTILLLPFLFPNTVFGQEGCTDPQASNYDPDANVNDGSCLYAPTNYQLTQETELPFLLKETSGLAFLDNQLWTHNDGGNENEVYQIELTDSLILHTVDLATAINKDWEDLAEDDQYLYVGDFGNNSGNRDDLVVYRVDRDDLDNNVAVSESIHFAYEDQIDFDPGLFNSNYDCEAFFMYNDSLHLFTKRWTDNRTMHYVLSAEPGNQVAFLRDSLETNLLITAADISENGEILLLGYSNVTGNAALWLLFDFPGSDFFRGNKRRINLGFANQNSQPEGLCFAGTYDGYVSSENFAQYPQKLLSFSIEQWILGSSETPEPTPHFKVNVFPNPAFTEVCWSLAPEIRVNEIEIVDITGRVLLSESPINNCLNIESLPAGLYTAVWHTTKGPYSQLVKIK